LSHRAAAAGSEICPFEVDFEVQIGAGHHQSEFCEDAGAIPAAPADGRGWKIWSPAVNPQRDSTRLYTVHPCSWLYWMAMSDEEVQLVLRARGGDREAFGRLVEIYWSRLVRLARSMVGEGAAEDRVQEGLVIGWSRLQRLAHPEAFGAWVTRIVYRRCLRGSRQRSFDVAVDEAPQQQAPGNPEGELWVGEALAALAPRQRAVMHLTIVEGLTDGEISNLLGITAASARAHRRRARERLEVLLAHKGNRE
jgi:RNA polymerase sigma-70 factor (ECF subfamily)